MQKHYTGKHTECYGLQAGDTPLHKLTCIKAACQPCSFDVPGNPATLRETRGAKACSAFLAPQTALSGWLLFPAFPQFLQIISPHPLPCFSLVMQLELIMLPSCSLQPPASLHPSASCQQSPTDNPPATCHVATAHLRTPHQSTAVQVEAESGPLYAAPSASPKVGSVQSLPSILCCRWDHLSVVASCAGSAGWGGSCRRVSTPCLPGQNKQALGPYYIHLC